MQVLGFNPSSQRKELAQHIGTVFGQRPQLLQMAGISKVFNGTVTALDGMNLTKEKLKYYADNKDQPRGIYNNGRQFYLTLRAKF